MQNLISQWPEDFDFNTDSACQSIFKPFIERHIENLRRLDQSRPADITYIFHEHARRVAENVRETCLFMGLGERVADNMYWAVLPHDIGKIRLPTAIWDIQDKPDQSMTALRRRHTILGADIVHEELGDTDHPFKNLMLDIMLNHHEQMDGGGTHGLTGNQLSLPVRMASIVEAFDGWSTPRAHFKDRDISPVGVIKRMRDEKMHMFDRDLFEAFAEMMEKN